MRVTTASTIDRLHDKLQTVWLAGNQGAERYIEQSQPDSINQDLVGYLNLIHPNRIQVIGQRENDYLASLGDNSLEDTLKQIFEGDAAAVILSDGLSAKPDWISLADRHGIPLLTSPLSGEQLIDILQEHLSGQLSEKKVIHGVFMEVFGTGVLLTGPSNTGKSELALELVTRGHRLIADDAPEFRRISSSTINGTCPALLQDLVEVRGLGIINVRAMFGHNAIKLNKYLRLIIHLEQTQASDDALDRLQGSSKDTEVLGITIPRITIPIASGRNIAVLVETAVRNHILQTKGYNAYEDLVQRQKKMMESPDQ
jgi:HPr kinase/phosphorylase